MQNGGGATAAEIDAASGVAGFGFYVMNGSAQFYIDNIKLYKEGALPEPQDKLQAGSLRNIMNSLANGQYLLVVQKSYSVSSHKTLYPVVIKTFNVSGGVSDITTAEFEDKIAFGDKYIYTIYSQNNIIKMGKLEPAASLSFGLENFADVAELAAACGEGITDTANLLTISSSGGFNGSAALKIAASSGQGDIVLKKMWDFPDFDYFEFYYNVPTGQASFYLRLYLDTSAGYNNRAYVDFSSGNLRLSGSGIIRIPVDPTYMSVNGTTAENVKSQRVKGLGFYVMAGSAEFYVDNIKLYKESVLPAAENVTQEQEIRTIVENMAEGSGYRLVIEKAHIDGSPHKALESVVNAVFNVTGSGSDLTEADFEYIIPETAAIYIYTIYNAAGEVIHYGTFIIT